MPRNNRTSNPIISFFKGIANLLGRKRSDEVQAENQILRERPENERLAMVLEDNEADAPKLILSGLEVPEVLHIAAPVEYSQVVSSNHQDDDCSDTSLEENESNEVFNLMHILSAVASDTVAMRENQSKTDVESKAHFDRIHHSGQEIEKNINKIQSKQVQNHDELKSSVALVGERAQGLSNHLLDIQRNQDRYHQESKEAMRQASAKTQAIENTSQTIKQTQSEIKTDLGQLGRLHQQKHEQLQAAMGQMRQQGEGLAVTVNAFKDEHRNHHGQLQITLGQLNHQANQTHAQVTLLREAQIEQHEQLEGLIRQQNQMIVVLVNTILENQTQHQDLNSGMFLRLIELAENASVTNSITSAQVTRMSESMFKAPVTNTGKFKIDYDDRHSIFIFRDGEGLKLVGFKLSDLRVLSPNETKTLLLQKYQPKSSQELYETIIDDMKELTVDEVGALPNFSDNQFLVLRSSAPQARLGR